MPHKTTKHNMVSFLLLLVAVSMTVVVSSKKFAPLPAFHNKPETGSKRIGLSQISSFHEQQEKTLLKFRGGAEEDEEKENDDDDDEKEEDEAEVEAEEEDEKEESDDEVETDVEEESSEDESDEDDYYDDETTDEEEEEETALAETLKKKSVSKNKLAGPFVEPYFISPSLQMYTTLGTILLSRKIDMFNSKVVRLIRFCFVLQLVVQQAFIFYVRIMAKRNNDRTPVSVNNPLTNMLSSQLEKQQAGANDMVKNLASSFLKKDTTVAEYDMGQAMSMQGGILFNMALMWFLHFKMNQVQPLLVTTINGFMQLAYNPLFQVYVMGRNLERPFKAPEVLKDPRADAEEEDELTEESSTNEEETSDAAVEAEETDDDDDDEEDESSDDEEETEDDDDDSSDDEK